MIIHVFIAHERENLLKLRRVPIASREGVYDNREGIVT